MTLSKSLTSLSLSSSSVKWVTIKMKCKIPGQILIKHEWMQFKLAGGRAVTVLTAASTVGSQPSLHSPRHPSCPPSPDFQPLGAANSKFFLSPHKPSLPPLSRHLAGSPVKKTDATSALFMTLIPKPAQHTLGEGLGAQEAGGRHCPPGPDSHGAAPLCDPSPSV